MAFYICIDRKILTGLPIVSGYYVKEDWTLVKNFTKAFYMDPKFGKPPAPINPSVRIIPWPSQTYYVAAYVKTFIFMPVLEKLYFDFTFFKSISQQYD